MHTKVSLEKLAKSTFTAGECLVRNLFSVIVTRIFIYKKQILSFSPTCCAIIVDTPYPDRMLEVE